MVSQGIRLVYGGGNAGLMGAIANAMLAAGGEVHGVIPEFLYEREHGHTGITELHVVKSMTERKNMMADMSDGFIAMPGGMGTFEEIVEMLSWFQLKLHRKPCGLLNVDGFYDHFAALIQHAHAQGFMYRSQDEILAVEAEPTALLDAMRAIDVS